MGRLAQTLDLMNNNSLPSPLFKRNSRLGHMLLLGQRVEIHTTSVDSPLNSPCLYEFSVWSPGRILRSVYIGQASRGIGRPIEQYQEILANLRMNREKQLQRNSVTSWPYKTKNPWGFRWVHHELESVLHQGKSGTPFEVELCIDVQPQGTQKHTLNANEASAIRSWQSSHAVQCINGRPSLLLAPEQDLDHAWRNAV